MTQDHISHFSHAGKTIDVFFRQPHWFDVTIDGSMKLSNGSAREVLEVISEHTDPDVQTKEKDGRVMSWNHRVIRHTDVEGDTEYIWFGVHEVFYPVAGDDLEGASWTENAINIIEDSPEELLKTVERIKSCMDKPILTIEGNCLKEWKP